MLNEFTLDFLTEDVTVRELIERRVYEEVQTYNTTQLGYFRGLVQPTDAEATLNGYRLRQRRQTWVPFEGDGTLSVILSKAFLLAADTTITDETILRPIHRT
jgi:hypothetical protein